MAAAAGSNPAAAPEPALVAEPSPPPIEPESPLAAEPPPLAAAEPAPPLAEPDSLLAAATPPAVLAEPAPPLAGPVGPLAAAPPPVPLAEPRPPRAGPESPFDIASVGRRRGAARPAGPGAGRPAYRPAEPVELRDARILAPSSGANPLISPDPRKFFATFGSEWKLLEYPGGKKVKLLEAN